jgi:hypothetical protein
MKQCEEHSIEKHVTGVSTDDFTSNCDAWAAYRDPAGRIFIQANRIFKEETRVIIGEVKRAQRCECRQHPAFYPLRSHRQRSRGLLRQRAQQ